MGNDVSFHAEYGLSLASLNIYNLYALIKTYVIVHNAVIRHTLCLSDLYSTVISVSVRREEICFIL